MPPKPPLILREPKLPDPGQVPEINGAPANVSLTIPPLLLFQPYPAFKPTYPPAQIGAAATGATKAGALVGMSAAEAVCTTPKLNATANKLTILERMAPISLLKPNLIVTVAQAARGKRARPLLNSSALVPRRIRAYVAVSY